MNIRFVLGMLGVAALSVSMSAAIADEPLYKYDPANPESRMAMAECEHKLPGKATKAQLMACYQKEMKYRGEQLLYRAHQEEELLKAELKRLNEELQRAQEGK